MFGLIKQERAHLGPRAFFFCESGLELVARRRCTFLRDPIHDTGI